MEVRFRYPSGGYLNFHSVAVNGDVEFLHRFAGVADTLPHIDAKSVQGALNLGTVELAFTERSAGMRATVVDCGATLADAENSNFQTLINVDDRRAIVRDIAQLQINRLLAHHAYLAA